MHKYEILYERKHATWYSLKVLIIHTELWESKHIKSYADYVHSIKFKKKNQTSQPPCFNNILKNLS
jgi:hypothetical protein